VIRIGILSVAHMHAMAYVRGLQVVPDVEIVGVYDDDAVRGQHFADRFNLRWFKDMDPLLACVDATIICSENARHRFYVEQSASASLPMLCEKPLATTLDDGLAMLDAAKTSNVDLYMALPVRFTPGFSSVLAAVRAGHVGRILAIVGTNHGNMPPGWFLEKPLSGGGAVMDHTPHVADLMRLLARSEVNRVFAQVDSRTKKANIDDSAILTFDFANGIFATLDPSWSRGEGFPTWGDVTLEVVGTDGVIDFNAFRPHLDLYVPDTPNHRYVGFGENMDARLIQAFVGAIASETPHPLLARGIDGLRALEIALAAYESGASHRPVMIQHLL